MATELERNAKISIWWDIDNCPIPTNCVPHWISNNFLQALHQAGFEGEVSIALFGNVLQIDPQVEARLGNSGLTVRHVPGGGGGNDAASRKLMIDMFSWASDNPPPANILLISGDVDVWHALLQLKQLGYNIMLAHDQTTTPTVNPPTDIVWKLTSLLSGEPPEPIQR